MGKKIKKIKTCIFVFLLLLFVFWSGGLFAQQTPDILDLTVPQKEQTISRIFKVKKGTTLVIDEKTIMPKYTKIENEAAWPSMIITVILDENVSLSEITEDNPLFYLDFKYNNISHVNVDGPTLEVFKKVKNFEGSRTKFAILDSEAFFFIPIPPIILKNLTQFLL